MATGFERPGLDLQIASTAELAGRFRELLERAAREAIAERGRFRWAIPGGSVAKALLPGLGTAAVDWPSVDVFWVDERLVPPTSTDSNLGLAKRLLFDSGPARTARLHPFPTGHPGSAEKGALERNLLEAPLDLTLLGVGEDGHVASIFPGRPLDRAAVVVALDDAPKPPPRRISLGLTTIIRSRRIGLAAFGAGKARVLARLAADPTSDLPAAVVIREANAISLFLDPEAAGRLEPRPT